MRLPPNSGDLNPIETVWAKLRKDLAKREFEGLKNNRCSRSDFQTVPCVEEKQDPETKRGTQHPGVRQDPPKPF